MSKILNLEKLLIYAIIGLTISSVFFSLAIIKVYGQTTGIYEDQYVLCNHELICLTFNQDDYLSNSQIEEFQLFFDNDMDTYYIEELHD